MITNRAHAETLVQSLDQYIMAMFSTSKGEAPITALKQTRGFLVLAIVQMLDGVAAVDPDQKGTAADVAKSLREIAEHLEQIRAGMRFINERWSER